MSALFIAIFYQPLLNALVLFYWLIGKTPLGYDMGMAVILLTILVRIILLPLTISAAKGEKDRHEIQQEVARLKVQYASDPVRQKQMIKHALQARPSVILSEGISFVVQVIVALVLWRIFSRGLLGEDLHFLYGWIPEVPQPYNLTFIGKFDLTHPDFFLNITQSILIFLVETFAVSMSAYPVSQAEAFRVRIVLPVVSFIIFAFLPAGKKLFVVGTLFITLLIQIIKLIIRMYQRFFSPPPSTEPEVSLAEESHSSNSDVAH